MRFILIILIWIFFVGGLWAYTLQRDAALPKGPSQVAAPEAMTGEWLLELTPSFSIEKDPFALTSEDEEVSGLEVKLNGRALTMAPGEIVRGKVIRLTQDLNITAGFNEFYVKASPPVAESLLDHGLRVRLLDNGVPVVDQTVWGSRGATVSGTVSFSLAAHKEDDHDH